MVDPKEAKGETYHFLSEFAILSSRHFLNCFVRGTSKISYYLRAGEGFLHCMEGRLSERIKGMSLMPTL